MEKDVKVQVVTEQNGVKELVERVSTAARDFLRQHIELAKLETRASLKKVSRDAILLVLGGLFALFALILLSIALSVAIGNALGSVGWGFLIVGLLWLIAAAVCVGVGLSKLRKEKERVLPATKHQIRLDREAFARV